ncbi:DUF3048 domain-containing protein [Candidatus Roizmanbacteria bacterium]|nr:DUF3048 domain-containing protein [Candidatus Roizmanbacteria bacterium]
MPTKYVIGGSSVVIFLLSTFFSYRFFVNASSNGGIIAGSGTSKKVVQSLTIADSDADSKEPRTEACPLNGGLYSKTQMQKWEKRRPLGVMIENHTEARPQSGLSSADVVYEAVAEGGITRFLSVYYCEDAKFVGPVRSARMYFLQLLEGYGNNPLYAHVGGANTPGDADALGTIEDLGWAGYNDLNQFSVPFPYFWRDYDRLPDRATEHTMYSETAKLWDFASKKRELTNVDAKGIAWNANFTPWTFKDDAINAERGTVTDVSFGFWDASISSYGVKWHYDKTSNSYKRENGGAPHVDKNTNKAIEVKNVIVVFAKESPANDGYEGGHILYKVVGSGDGLLFQDGTSQKISWSKSKATSMMTFSDAAGKDVKLTRGKLFVEILPIGNKVTY